MKNIIYLDEDKMLSFSSQLFEGATEYVLNETQTVNEDTESQKGPLGSGRLLSNLLQAGNKTTEKKFLYDFSYSLFENKLIANKKVLFVDEDSESAFEHIVDRSFIKIKARAVFNDISMIKAIIRNFNSLGEAIAYVTNFDAISELREKLTEAEASASNNKERTELRRKLKSVSNVKKIAQESSLWQDPDFLNYIEQLLGYGYQDQFEIQQRVRDVLFSACLKREFLRESEELLIKKYSRKTEADVVVFGIVTQSMSGANEDIPVDDDNGQTLKEALMGIVDRFTDMEKTFIGRLPNEIVLDPIAIYTEL